MQVKIILKDNSRYAEVGQTNPIRWKTMFRNDDGSFIDQSGWIKCKDFFNDTVAYFKEGSEFSIYSYKNAIKKNEEGVWMLLKYIGDMPAFLHNINVINDQLLSDGLTPMDYKELASKDEILLLIPNELWETTYHISLITMAVRLCNYGLKFDKWADMFKDNSAMKADGVFTTEACNNAIKHGFKLPEPFNKFWWYCGKKHNSDVVKKQTGYVIHNNGACEWSRAMASGV